MFFCKITACTIIEWDVFFQDEDREAEATVQASAPSISWGCSPSCHSLASSVSDLSLEAEQLDKAVRANDTQVVRRTLELHHGSPFLDKSSEGSQDFFCRDLSPALEPPRPPLFANALHLAVECNSLDVARLLLKYGTDPSEPGMAPSSVEQWRRGSCNSNNFLSPCSSFKYPTTNSTASSGGNSGSKKFVLSSRQCLDPQLRTVYHTSDDKRVYYDEHYTRDVLYALAPLFLAVAVGNATMVHLLLKYGASPRVQDGHGVTPLHLATCQSKVSWSCVRLLLERGARISVPNNQGVCPHQLLDSSDLGLMQKSLVEDAFSCFLAHPVSRVEGEESFLSTGNSFRNYFLLRRFQEGKGTSRQSSKVKEDEEASHQDSLPRNSLENSSHTEDDVSEMLDCMDQRRCSSTKSKGRTRTPSEPSETRVSRAEVNLYVLTKMATNEECLLPLLTNFHFHLPAIIELMDNAGGQRLHKPAAAFLEQLLKTTYQHFLASRQMHALCLLLRVAVGCLRAGQSLQYSGLLLINKVIDTCVVHALPLDPGGDEGSPRVDGPSSILSGTCTQLLLNALNNGITLQKRGVGIRLHCTPSHR
ncbi:ANK_REP_REGION domain-containing protein [Caerostris darwini]|uniref:ANK_REP_REGION domain-containing protein n=1 Tax=Caerostris darwini TaxID=1538125 RepID=A0AAV4VI68_9ARAC|nr:ANK_REP_REGION domain-containing protein [Caerostris darwini]